MRKMVYGKVIAGVPMIAIEFGGEWKFFALVEFVDVEKRMKRVR